METLKKLEKKKKLLKAQKQLAATNASAKQEDAKTAKSVKRRPANKNKHIPQVKGKKKK